jgi:hypothetical protein
MEISTEQKLRRRHNQKKYMQSPAGQAYLRSDAHRESIRKHNRKRDKTHREETQRKTREIKMASGCLLCGFKSHPAALEFHHRDPKTKKFRLAMSRNYSWKMCLEEIAKCDVLCANCHAILEYDKKIQRKAADDGV